ncbi:hypothetical protein E4S40_08125 [Algoriphagus kandeliae]|uniref:Uncharacterized protein n=1 Tax=Algoriphagus kandeliae TaxID=2562278 RepID=A0A4Y9QUA6_9BACT|nr:hypothetical protein [Algoriphagus kandeliae]TFV96181.1 hypothetical protein E4S40_08125 [Algoriphagus kandeliae]
MNFPDEFKKPPLTLGDWIINLIISKIPLIGFIVLIVWAIDKSTEPNKANWAKSELIIRLIGFLIGVIIISIVGLSFFTHFSDQMDW